MRMTIIALGSAALLSACTTTTIPTLEQQLAGKSDAERAAILKQTCDKEAEWRRISNQPFNSMQTSHIKRSKSICAEYDKELSRHEGNDTQKP